MTIKACCSWRLAVVSSHSFGQVLGFLRGFYVILSTWYCPNFCGPIRRLQTPTTVGYVCRWVSAIACYLGIFELNEPIRGRRDGIGIRRTNQIQTFLRKLREMPTMLSANQNRFKTLRTRKLNFLPAVESTHLSK